MDHFLHEIEITNFKSIRHQKIEGCKRINVFIGYPNVGKSNVLEALAMFSLPYLKLSGRKKLGEFIRVKNLRELFYEANTSKPFEIILNGGQMTCKSQFDETTVYPLACIYEHAAFSAIYFNEALGARFDEDSSGRSEQLSYIKSYRFGVEDAKPVKRYFPFLLPPKGSNLFSALPAQNDLNSFLREELGRSGGEFVYDKTENTARIFKRNNGDTYSIPYTSIADTLQRLIFYKAAVESNKDAVIVFEEPEAHMFPPYVSKFTADIIFDDGGNQYFINTHSPFVVSDFLEERDLDLSIYVVGLKNGETTIKRLTDEELHEVYQYGIDLFFNLESYLDE